MTEKTLTFKKFEDLLNFAILLNALIASYFLPFFKLVIINLFSIN